MEKRTENIKYLEYWYDFYKSINREEYSQKWLLDLTLDFYEQKLSRHYHKQQNYDLPEMDILAPP